MSTRGFSGRGRRAQYPYNPETMESIIQAVLRGSTLSQAAADHQIPYHRISYWLRYGRQDDGPEEWRRFVVRLAWADLQVAEQNYHLIRQRLFPESDPSMGSQALIFQ